MPNFRKLAPEEVKTYENKGKGTRKLVEEQYDSILADYEVGDYGEAVLDEGENRLTVRNRMKAAATRRGMDISFRRTQGDILRFQIVEHSNGVVADAVPAAVESAVVATSTPPPPAKRKSGRPKAQEKGAIDRLEEIAGKLQQATNTALEDIGIRRPGRPKKKA